MVARKHISLTLGFVFLILFLMGFYLMFFPPTTRVSQQNESWSEISLPTPVPAHSTRQVAFSAKAGNYITFNLRPETGFPPGPIIGQITVNVYLGTLSLYSSTADRIDGTVNLPETASYTFQVVNDNDFEVSFESAGFYASSLKLYSLYLEYSEKSNTSLQSAGFMLFMASFIVGAATLLIVTVQAKKT
jgi:hypothetical protein